MLYSLGKVNKISLTQTPTAGSLRPSFLIPLHTSLDIPYNCAVMDNQSHTMLYKYKY